MIYPADENRIYVKNARPRFIADLWNNLFWISDRDSGLVMVFADRAAVIEFFQQMQELMELIQPPQ